MFRSLIVFLVLGFAWQSASAIRLEIRVTSEDHPTDKTTALLKQKDFNVPKGVPPKTRTVEVTQSKKLSLVTVEHKKFSLRSISQKDEREFLWCFKRCSADAKLSLPGRKGLIALFDLSQQRREDLSPYHGLKVMSHDEEILDEGEVHVKRAPDRTVGFVFLGMTPPQEARGHRPLIHGKKMIFPLFFVPVFPPDMEGELQRDVIKAVVRVMDYITPFYPMPISRPMVKSKLSPSEPLAEKDAPSSSRQKATHLVVSLHLKDPLGSLFSFCKFEESKTASKKQKADPKKKKVDPKKKNADLEVSRVLYIWDLSSEMSDSDDESVDYEDETDWETEEVWQSLFESAQTQKVSDTVAEDAPQDIVSTSNDQLAESSLSNSLGDLSLSLLALIDESMNNQADPSDHGDTTVEVSQPFALFSQHTLSPFITEQPASTTSAVPPICRSCSPLLSCTPLAQCVSACFSGFCGTRALSDDTLSSKDE